MRFYWRSWALCLTFVLASCASTPKHSYTHPSEILDWQLQGKLAVALPGKSQSAYFNWKNSTDHYDIRVNGPLGQGSAQLIKSSNTVTLRYDGGEYQAPTGEQLMQQHLGWSFPVSNMYWWIKGLPVPGSETAAQEFDEQGQLKELQQQGWKIRYLRYQAVDQVHLPYKIVAQREQIKLTLLLKKWRLGP